MTGASYRADVAVPDFPDDRPLFVFDGVCALCSGFVQFLLRHDHARRFRFATAQSALGAALYRHYGLATAPYATNLLILDGAAYLKSDAFIACMIGLGGPWTAFALLRLCPRVVRDAVYTPIARNRYRLFGRHGSCYVPDAGDAGRFLD